MPTAELSDATNARLQGIAIPLTDTHDSVISRLLDHWDATKSTQPKIVKLGEPIKTLDDGTMEFDPANPPPLNFTTCLQIIVNGQTLGKNDTYWNNMMIAVIRELHKKGLDAAAIKAMLQIANAEIGRKEDNGYKFLSDVGLSVQGQDSNAAFRQAHLLAMLSGVKFQVWFKWQDNEKAAHANHRGLLEV